jgi:hypothetical protein
VVEALGDELLAGPALANDQHRPVERGGTAGALDCVENGVALADESFSTFHVSQIWPTVGAKCHELARYFARLNGGFERFFEKSGIFGKWHVSCMVKGR